MAAIDGDETLPTIDGLPLKIRAVQPVTDIAPTWLNASDIPEGYG